MESKAKLQMLDSYVKEYSMILQNKIDSSANVTYEANLAFAINYISKEENNYVGQIEMKNDMNLQVNKENIGKIHIVMQGIFVGDIKLTREEFEEMLKLNGATTLSHLIRAYIHTNTSLSNMPIIDTAMINFVDFFKDNEKK